MPALAEYREKVAKYHAEMEETLKQAMRVLGRPPVHEVWLFGSLATGEVVPGSDVDLLVVMPTEKRPVDRADEFREAISTRIGLDYLVYTPEEFERLRQWHPLVKRIVRTGRKIYEGGSKV